MHYWEILGIEPDSDKKTIKIAYARLLKKTRPDDDPEGFKRLHKAYQQALNNLSATNSPTDSEWPPEISHQTEITLPVEIKQQSNEVTQSISTVHNDFLPDNNETAIDLEPEPLPDPIIEQLQQDWSTLFQQVDDLIASPTDRQLLQNWQFIGEHPSLLDLEFKSNVSDELFRLIALTNLEEKEEDTPPAIPAVVLDRLGEIFYWEEKWSRYQKKFDDELLDSIYPFLSHESQTSDEPPPFVKRDLYYLRRILAFMIDILIIVFLKGLTDAAGLGLDTKIGLLVYFACFIPLLEASPWQASIGKKIMGLIVTDKHGIRLSTMHSFWRSSISLICIIGFKFVVWINLYTAYKFGTLFQDAFSSSYVDKPEK